jgi:hypothetical protein
VDERLLSAAVLPTIADLQREMADAGPNPRRRLRARCRGYVAFWTVMIAAPVVSRASPPGDAGTMAFPDALARIALASILITLAAVAGPAVRWWLAGVVAAGAVSALLLHAWYGRHPSALPEPAEPVRRIPQINFSSTDVAGNVGGLIFVVGSVFIVSLAVPTVIWFLTAATASGALVAWWLTTRRRTHPHAGIPEHPLGIAERA